MSTRFEGAGAKDTRIIVLKPGEEIGDDVVPEDQVALCFDYDEVFYLQGKPWDIGQLLQDGLDKLKEASVALIKLFDLASIQPAQSVIQANQSRVRGDQEPCAVCGKPVRDLVKFQVHLSNQGNVYPTSIDVDVANNLPEGTMYFFPVGPDCAKKIPSGYLHIEKSPL